MSVKLFTLDGKQVLTKPLPAGHKLPLEVTANGTYILQVLNSEGQVLYTEKLITH